MFDRLGTFDWRRCEASSSWISERLGSSVIGMVPPPPWIPKATLMCSRIAENCSSFLTSLNDTISTKKHSSSVIMSP